MRKQLGHEIIVGIFVALGTVLIMIAIILLGATDGFFVKKNHYFGHFDNVGGLIVGSKVQLGGLPVGGIEKIEFDKVTKNILVKFSVKKEFQDWVRKDSSIEVATQGILGDKYLSISPGNSEQPLLPDGSELPNTPSKDISQFINKGDKLMYSLNRIASSLERILNTFETDNRSDVFFKGMAKTATNLATATQKINDQISELQLKRISSNLADITEKINNGSGTLGEFLNDSTLYDELRALMGGVNRNRLIRNLIRQTMLDKDKSSSKNE